MIHGVAYGAGAIQPAQIGRQYVNGGVVGATESSPNDPWRAEYSSYTQECMSMHQISMNIA